jgi:rubrerythrin
VSYTAGVINNTEENLVAAANGENEEWTELYPEFARIAEQEGFPKIASAFKLIATIEAEHEARFLKLLRNVEENKVFESDELEEWVCRKCGYVHKGKKALENCPACDHPKAYFERKAKNY